MKRIFCSLLLCLSFAFSANSQQSINDQLRDLFTPLRRSIDPTPHAPFLADMSVNGSDPKFYTPLSYDTSSWLNWFQLFIEMYHSSYQPGLLIYSDSLVLEAAEYTINTYSVIPIGVLDYEYNTFKPDVFDSLNNGVYFVWDDDSIWDPTGFPPSPYLLNTSHSPADELHTIFAASPLAENSYFRDVIYSINPNMFIYYDQTYNRDILGHPFPHTFQIDFGDGSGWIDVDPHIHAEIPVLYSSKGIKTVKVQVTYDGMPIKHSISTIEILSDEVRKQPDYTFHVPGINVGVYFACDNNGSQIRKPLIYLEGLDIFNKNDNASNYSYMLQSEYEGVSMLKNEGYDIIMVDWADGAADMLDNAEYFIGLLEYLKCEVALNNQQFVVVGESMGGVIARYALTKMETDDYINSLTLGVNTCMPPHQSHNTRLFISLDAPHQGAYVPLAGQHMGDVAFHLSTSLSSSIVGLLIGGLIKTGLEYVLNKPAVKQLLILHKSTRNGSKEYGPHQDRIDFMDELVALNPSTNGYPEFCKTLAISNGDMNGINQLNYLDEALHPGASYLNLSLQLRVKLFWSLDIPLFNFDAFQFNAIDTMPNSEIVSFVTTSFGFSLKGCLMRIFGPSWNPFSNACGIHSILNNTKIEVNVPVAWDVMPGGTQANPVAPRKSNNFGVNLGIVKFGFVSVPGNSRQLTIGVPALPIAPQLTITGTSDIVNFCFIPIQSGLDYTGADSQNHVIIGDGITTINSRTPFDAVVARNSNRAHLVFVGGPAMPDDNPPDYPSPWVNGEIGDYEIWLDNQTVNRRAHYEGRNSLIAGSEVSQVLRYTNFASSFSIVESASENFGFLVSSDNGNVSFVSATQIILRPGFQVQQGGVFRAYIDSLAYCTKTHEELGIMLPEEEFSNVIQVSQNTEQTIKVYPNPSTGFINFIFPDFGTYSLYNQMGQVISTLKIAEGESLNYTTEILGAGFYYIVSMDMPLQAIKFIIIK